MKKIEGYFCFFPKKWSGCKKKVNICCYICEYYEECKKHPEFQKWQQEHCEFDKTYCLNMV